MNILINKFKLFFPLSRVVNFESNRKRNRERRETKKGRENNLNNNKRLKK